MQRIFIIALLSLMAIGCRTRQVTVEMPAENEDKECSPHVLIIYYDAGIGSGQLLDAAKKMGCEVIYQYNIIKGVALRVPDKADIDDAIKALGKVKGVLQVSRDRITHMDRHE